ncbi:MarR family transcriptional regulator [Sphingobacterium sp. lm-10]|uniref:MarR family winged helix-turn-helix transcriptional regulator n=1 Tax=Sphingobacterium sp. lm-10 TaxID=2944904 RepID=UPI002020EDB0|nr:MarR family transcriptional regulator [Sphingobacterium sp. lm-10]MCL7986894.1 MarR family transcriptional regulator [Sphingobacterium sp. lm-10]
MNYDLIQAVIKLVSEFEHARTEDTNYGADLPGFKNWVADLYRLESDQAPDWAGIAKGRSPESVISTLLVHLNRYAKNYSRSAMFDSEFSTQEDYIYLINLKAFGEMSKMALIKKNIHDKPVGMQIINRLIKNGWVVQVGSRLDRRSKLISITDGGLQVLKEQMQKIRQATQVVSANLTTIEKLELIRLLQKLESFHHPLYQLNVPAEMLLDKAYTQLTATTTT